MNKLSARLYHGDTNLHFDEIMMSVLCWPHTYFDFHGPIPMKEKPVNRHVTPLEHITLIPSQPVIALTPSFYVRESTDTSFIVFDLTPPGFKTHDIHHWR